ncbi:MAG TPA: DoxX family protein [Acidimicrobiia bacterium]|nr:DoxX family protein [Acidimicrobiia bacterium]
MSRRKRRIVLVLAAAQVVDAIGNALVPKAKAAAHLDHLGVPDPLRPLLPVIKVAGSAGLLLGRRVPRLGVLVSAGLVAYYTAAAQYHLGAGDPPRKALPAVAFGTAAIAVLVATDSE